MADIAQKEKPTLHALPQVKDRMTFLYLERCTLTRQDCAIAVTDQRGTVHVPSAAITVLLLGPGTRITHRAMELIGDSGISVLWVGEQGVRYYAHGRPQTHSAGLLIRQAALVSNTRSRIAVARQMYQMRFPGEDVSSLTMQQLRGREGARVRGAYRRAAAAWNLPWDGRNYDPEDYSSGDPVNMVLSAGNACLYGVAHGVIAALGCAPGLGFVHTGHERSFVYDIADLYKAELTIPLAFEIAASCPEDVGGAMRRRLRDAFMNTHILERIVRDIRRLLLGADAEDTEPGGNVLFLWDDRLGQVANGVSYGVEPEEQFDEAASAGYGRIVEDPV